MIEAWVLYVVLLNSSTGEEMAREEVGRFDEMVMCMKAGMEFGAIVKAQEGTLPSFRCAKTVFSKEGPTT
jgi:hypothetical protein